MRLTSLSALHGLVGLALMALPARASIHAYEHAQVNSRAMPPDVYNIKVAHLDPEDAVWDPQRKLLYQSNLYRAKVSVSDTKSGHKFGEPRKRSSGPLDDGMLTLLYRTQTP